VKFPRATRLFLGDVAGQRIANQLDVPLDDGQLGLLLLDHGLQAVDACGVPSGQLGIAVISDGWFSVA
jgi:hypothetical protein